LPNLGTHRSCAADQPDANGWKCEYKVASAIGVGENSLVRSSRRAARGCLRTAGLAMASLALR
jgi:hypothetical protein